MNVEIRVIRGDKIHELVSLVAWLRRERDLQGVIQPVTRAVGEEELGGSFDMISVALGAGGFGVALAQSLSAWLANQHSDVKIKVTTPGRTVELDAQRVTDAQALLRDVLRDDDES
jgi:hypothetical protein